MVKQAGTPSGSPLPLGQTPNQVLEAQIVFKSRPLTSSEQELTVALIGGGSLLEGAEPGGDHLFSFFSGDSFEPTCRGPGASGKTGRQAEVSPLTS